MKIAAIVLLIFGFQASQPPNAHWVQTVHLANESDGGFTGYWACADNQPARLKLLPGTGMVAAECGPPSTIGGSTDLTVAGPTFVDTSKPEFWRMVENHCVAVLTEARTEKIDPGGVSFDPLYEIDKDGNRIRHIPEQTLKLRCE